MMPSSMTRQKKEYICPAGQALIWRYSYVEKGLKLHRFWSSKCRGCQGATAFIIPSLYEGFGIPPLEAQACDCPVLASDVAAMPEVLHRSALYFDPLSVSDIASAMDLILNELALRQILKKLGRSNVDRFSWKKSANLISQHIDALLIEKHAFSL